MSLLRRFERISDNLDGLLPALFREAGFENVEVDSWRKLIASRANSRVELRRTITFSIGSEGSSSSAKGCNGVSGPVGAVVTPALGGVGPWSDLPQASSLCGACREVCPVRIDIPRMLLELRSESCQAGKTPWWLKMGLTVYRFVVVRPRLFRLAIGVARLATRVLAHQGWLRRSPPPLSGWTAHRDFPAFAREPFSAQFKRRR